MTNTNNTKALQHEIKKLSNGKRELHILVYGKDITRGQRVLTDKNPDIIQEDADFFNLLNEKADELVAKDPHWIITGLADWRSWASSNIKEFYDNQDKELAKELLELQANALGEQYNE